MVVSWSRGRALRGPHHWSEATPRVSTFTRTIYHRGMDLQLDGRRAIVTGGSRGIGLAVARVLATEGARVALVARGVPALEEAARALSAVAAAADAGGNATLGEREPHVIAVPAD